MWIVNNQDLVHGLVFSTVPEKCTFLQELIAQTYVLIKGIFNVLSPTKQIYKNNTKKPSWRNLPNS